MENPEPVFTAAAVRLMGPPQAVKDKHVRLRISPAAGPRVGTGLGPLQAGPFDSAQGRLRPATTQLSSSSWRSNVTFNTMGWSLKESCDKLQLLAGDRLDIAYTLGMNDHPEFGGLELTLRDLRCTE
jgi:single-stranded-DNA-specific exonuclease